MTDTQQGTAKQILSYSPEIPRRTFGLPSVPRLRTAGAKAPRKSENHSKLIVGQGVALSGKVGDCENLVVQGHVELEIADCRHMEITPDGAFKGRASVDEATIGGRFDGELNVTGMLRLCGTGVVTGTVHYGELIVEAGGQLKGTSEPTEDARSNGKG